MLNPEQEAGLQQKGGTMSNAVRIIWLLTLGVFVAGCTTYRSVPLPAALEAPGPSGPSADAVKEGDNVRITLHNGGEVRGKVLAAGPQDILLRIAHHDEAFAVSSVEDEEVRIGTHTIRSVEKRRFSVGETLILLGVIALPIVAIGVGMESVDMSMDSGNWGTPVPY